MVEHLHQRQVRLVMSSVLDPVRQQLDRYGISAALGADAYYDTPGRPSRPSTPPGGAFNSLAGARRCPSISAHGQPDPSARAFLP
jgi:hypothetical protein